MFTAKSEPKVAKNLPRVLEHSEEASTGVGGLPRSGLVDHQIRRDLKRTWIQDDDQGASASHYRANMRNLQATEQPRNPPKFYR